MGNSVLRYLFGSGELLVQQRTEKEERIFLFLAGVFISALVMANILGISKFVDIKLGNLITLQVPVGVLPYPATFLATDLISELYGKERANFVVLVGFFMNFFILFFVTLGHILPVSDITADPELFGEVYGYMVRGVVASMAAYLTAQFVDVQLFHFWKRVTRGKYLWLRNNASTMTSQMVDSIAVVTLTFAGKLPMEIILATIFYSYLFKFMAALLDTPFAYLGVALIKPHVTGDPMEKKWSI